MTSKLASAKNRIGFDLTIKSCYFACNDITIFKAVKLKTSHTVILPTYGECSLGKPFLNLSLAYLLLFQGLVQDHHPDGRPD